MDRKPIAQRRFHLAEIGGPLQQRPLLLGGGDLRLPGLQLGMALALLAMMMRQQDPLQPPHTDFPQVLQDASVAQIDQQRRVTVSQHVDVADVLPKKQLDAGILHERLEPSRFCPGTRAAEP